MSFLKRLGTSAALIGLTALILFKWPAFFFSLEVIVFSALALYEYLTMLKRSGVAVSRLFGITMGIIIPLVVYMEYGLTQSGEVLFLVLGCLFLFILKFFRDTRESLVGIASTLFGILYVGWFLSFLIKIRFLEGGVIWVAYLIAVTKAADIGAYCVGTTFGRHTLIPHISPRKTMEGLLGGLAAGVLTSLAFHPCLPIRFGVFHVTVVGFLIAVLGQIGDLSESLMKRFCNEKDSGRVLPGMGGVLDAVDSILFTAPLFYFYLLSRA